MYVDRKEEGIAHRKKYQALDIKSSQTLVVITSSLVVVELVRNEEKEEKSKIFMHVDRKEE